MIDNYVNTTETLALYVYDGGNRVSADATPAVAAVDEEGTSVTMTGVTVNNHPDGYDYYTANIAPSEVKTTREIVVTWSYAYGGNSYERIEVVNVVRPYFEPPDLWNRYPQYDSTGAEPMTYDEIQNIERQARFIVDTYCNQKFQDYGLKTKKVRGSGTNALQLPEHIYYLESLTAGESLVLFERDGDGVVTTDIAEWNEDEPYLITKKGSDVPTVTFRDKDPFVEVVDRTKALFRSNRLYNVEAKYGWERLPQEVAEAALLLAYESLQHEDRYRAKNITVIRSADYRMEFGGDHHTTTGNVTADNLLSDYVNTGVHVF